MAFEKVWRQVLPTSFTLDGSDNGLITISDTDGFKVKQEVQIKALTQPSLTLEIKRVISPTQLYVGPKGHINLRSDLSSYTVLLSSTIEASEQKRPEIPIVEHERAVYDEEPTLAKRVVNVDKYGRYWDLGNPMPVTMAGAEINIEGANREGFSILNIPTSATEVSFTFPNATRCYSIRCRDSEDIIKISNVLGNIALGNYWTVHRGSVDTVPISVEYQNGYKLYFESKSKNNVNLEIRYWYKV